MSNDILCPRCKKIKHSSNFYVQKNGKNGLASYCKECSKSAHKEWLKKNVKSVNHWQKDYRKKRRLSGNLIYRDASLANNGICARNNCFEKRVKYSSYCREHRNENSRVSSNKAYSVFREINKTLIKYPPEYYPFLETTESEGSDILIFINSLVSKKIPEKIREDICQNVAVALLDGSLERENAKANIDKYCRKVFAEYSEYRQISIDDDSFYTHGLHERLVGSILRDDVDV